MSTDFTGWWVYIAGPVAGAAIAMVVITAVRGLPNKEEREAAGSSRPAPSHRAAGAPHPR